MYKMDYEKLLLKLWNYAPGHHRDGPWRILTLTKSTSQGRTIVHYLPSMQNEERDAIELIYNIKRDWEFKHKVSPHPQKKWTARDELENLD